MKRILLLTMLAIFLITASGLVLSVSADAKEKESDRSATSTPPRRTVDLLCMQAAVEKRDTAILVGFNAYHASTTPALTARRDALKAAWTKTDKKERQTAIRAAWNTYRDAFRSVRKVFKAAKRSAWKQFKADRKTCRGTSDEGVGDGIDETL